MKKIRKLGRRILAVFLAALVFFQTQVSVMAQTASDVSGLSLNENPRLAGLMDSGYLPSESEPLTSIAQSQQVAGVSGNEVADMAMDTVAGNAAEEILDSASEILEELYALGITEANETAAKGYTKLAEDMAKTDDLAKFGSGFLKGLADFMNLFSIIDDILSMKDLQNENLIAMIAEYAFLWADLCIALLGLLGLIGFPWSLILGILIGFLANFFRSETFRNWEEKNHGEGPDWFESWILKIFDQRKVPDYVGAYKPNIYIYSTKQQSVTVDFEKPELLTKTIPDYSKGWEVTTGKNGKLTDADGKEYDYLFYESVTEKHLFQTDYGYRIPASDRAETFAKILGEMGFSDRETEDFIEFWDEKLPKEVDYVMYPQDTAYVDRAMPLQITAEPEAVTRIWFAFEADTGQQVETPDTIFVDRETDYYVVEWGGMIFDE